MKIQNKYTGHAPEDEFVYVDDYLGTDRPCPICGAAPDQMCSIYEPGQDYTEELCTFMHIERVFASYSNTHPDLVENMRERLGIELEVK